RHLSGYFAGHEELRDVHPDAEDLPRLDRADQDFGVCRRSADLGIRGKVIDARRDFGNHFEPIELLENADQGARNRQPLNAPAVDGASNGSGRLLKIKHAAAATGREDERGRAASYGPVHSKTYRVILAHGGAREINQPVNSFNTDKSSQDCQVICMESEE